MASMRMGLGESGLSSLSGLGFKVCGVLGFRVIGFRVRRCWLFSLGFVGVGLPPVHGLGV